MLGLEKLGRLARRITGRNGSAGSNGHPVSTNGSGGRFMMEPLETPFGPSSHNGHPLPTEADLRLAERTAFMDEIQGAWLEGGNLHRRVHDLALNGRYDEANALFNDSQAQYRRALEFNAVAEERYSTPLTASRYSGNRQLFERDLAHQQELRGVIEQQRLAAAPPAAPVEHIVEAASAEITPASEAVREIVEPQAAVARSGTSRFLRGAGITLGVIIGGKGIMDLVNRGHEEDNEEKKRSSLAKPLVELGVAAALLYATLIHGRGRSPAH